MGGGVTWHQDSGAVEARLEPTDSPAQAGPGWPPPGPGTVHQNRPGLPTPAAVPPAVVSW